MVEGTGGFWEGVRGDQGPRGEGRAVAVAVMLCMSERPCVRSSCTFLLHYRLISCKGAIIRASCKAMKIEMENLDSCCCIT